MTDNEEVNNNYIISNYGNFVYSIRRNRLLKITTYPTIRYKNSYSLGGNKTFAAVFNKDQRKNYILSRTLYQTFILKNEYYKESYIAFKDGNYYNCKYDNLYISIRKISI